MPRFKMPCRGSGALGRPVALYILPVSTRREQALPLGIELVGLWGDVPTVLIV